MRFTIAWSQYLRHTGSNWSVYILVLRIRNSRECQQKRLNLNVLITERHVDEIRGLQYTRYMISNYTLFLLMYHSRDFALFANNLLHDFITIFWLKMNDFKMNFFFMMILRNRVLLTHDLWLIDIYASDNYTRFRVVLNFIRF